MAKALDFILIDDSPLDCFITEKVIKNAGLAENVKIFELATKAIEYLRNAEVPKDGAKVVIIVDIYMPLMNGFEFVEAFEQLPEDVRDHYLLYMLSSSINQSDINRVANYKSVRHFLNKPLKGALMTSLLKEA